MAPEQWEGKPGDARTDVYCFGHVLYEMLTGKRAMPEGRTPLASAQLDSIVRTCLEQAPDDRWQSARDTWRAMTLPASPAPKPRRTLWWVATAALVILAAALASALWFNRRAAGGEVVTFAIYPPEKTMFSGAFNITLGVPQFALSPDGRTIVFVAGAEGEPPLLWRRVLDQLVAQALPGTEDAEDPFWSPDSRWIGFRLMAVAVGTRLSFGIPRVLFRTHVQPGVTRNHAH